jgi:alkanesulfonate monooxygenase SsuD/methylene tetrahydromethanopterin reductase-like flavin-dependent oxidoreductase (luciferase family)
VTDIRLGALCWNQYTDWPSLLEAGKRAERLGYDTLWTWDHLYPIIGDSNGPIFEGWLTTTAWAQATERIRIGLMVGANTFRNPALVAKMATTLDHISNGRAILGIGAAWFDEEHRDFGLEFGDGPPERLRWLAEALPIMRGMLDGTEPTARGPHYFSRHTRNLPAPIQAHLPICIGGGGEKVTLKLVARYGDMNNIGGGSGATAGDGGVASARPVFEWVTFTARTSPFVEFAIPGNGRRGGEFRKIPAPCSFPGSDAARRRWHVRCFLPLVSHCPSRSIECQ